jgi:hypothetical protein
MLALAGESTGISYVDDRITVHLADELIDFLGYQGPCRQLILLEPGPRGDLTPVLQVLTSDLQACAPDLLFTLKDFDASGAALAGR